jgi:N-sulfoglucosamine sulfohydrolase
MAELVRTGDPRVVDDGRYFETPPLAGPLNDESTFWKLDKPKKNKNKNGK